MGTLIYPLGWTRDRHGNRCFAVPRQLEGSIPLLDLAKLNPGIPTYCVVVDCTTELQLDQNRVGETASSLFPFVPVKTSESLVAKVSIGEPAA